MPWPAWHTFVLYCCVRVFSFKKLNFCSIRSYKKTILKASALWVAAFYKSKCLCVCPCVCSLLKLSTADVTALYSNIPLEEGMSKFKEALDNPKLRPQPKLPTSFLMTLLSFVLFFNVFIFNGHHFLPLIGTAMGTRVAPTFACIFMGWLEVKILASWMGTQPYMWKRYIDDIFPVVRN